MARAIRSEQGRANRRRQKREAQHRDTDQRNEIGTIPKIKSSRIPIRKKSLASLEYFLTYFFKDLFSDPFGEVQKSSIGHEQYLLERGAGNINKLEPRGYGKSTRSIIAACWACLKGSQNFVMVCCDSKEKATDLLKIAHMSLGENKRLLGCFPELLPFHKLEGNSHRCQYQTFRGELTKISIKGDTIYFPVLDGSHPCEGAMIVARPVGKARGKNIEGRRPTLVILDDIQTSEQAFSPTGPGKILKMVTSDIAFLGTRKNPVAIINNATVIADDDYPSKLAELKAFTTIRYKMVTSMPSNLKLWDEYQKIRQNYDQEIVGDDERAARDALKFYRSNLSAMDEGSAVTWDFAFSKSKHEISTIQAAMNFIADFGEESFNSECQNQPNKLHSDKDCLTAKEIMAKQHPHGRLVVPPNVDKLIAFVDVQQELLFWELWGFSNAFSGYQIADGTFPEQSARVFQKSGVRKKLSHIYKTTTLEARIKQAVLDLTDDLLSMDFVRQGDRAAMQIEMIGVDSRYKTDAVRSAYQDSKHKSRLQLCMGYGFGAKKKPQRLKALKKSTGQSKGFGWFLGEAQSGIQTLEIDTNRLKTFFHQRLATALDDPGSFSLYEAPLPVHELTAMHYTSEYRTTLTGPWGEVDEWDVKPGRPDNDKLDCGVGCVAIASFRGCQMVGTEERDEGRKRKKVDGRKWGKAS